MNVMEGGSQWINIQLSTYIKMESMCVCVCVCVCYRRPHRLADTDQFRYPDRFRTEKAIAERIFSIFPIVLEIFYI